MRSTKDLHGYQQSAIDWIYNHNASLALCPVGAGKTAIAWTAIAELMDDGHVERPIVFAPLRVAQLVWAQERVHWEHLTGRPVVLWGGEPASWEDSPWRTSRMLWGSRQSAEGLLPGVEQRTTDKIKRKKEQKAYAALLDKKDHCAHVLAYYEHIETRLTPNQIKDAVRAARDVLEDRLAEVTKEERRVNKLLRATTAPKAVHITSYENLLWLCELYAPGDSPFDMWVFDEIGKLKNPKSPRYKAVRKHTKVAPIVVGLNATPAPEGFEDLFTQVQIVDGGKLWGKSFYEWRQKYFVPSDYLGYSWRLQLGAKDLLIKDLNTLAFRVDEADLSYQKQMVTAQILVDMPEKARKAYAEMEKKLAVELDGREDIVAMSAAAASMKLRQISNGFIYDEDGKVEILHTAKADALSDLIDEMGREPLLVAYEFGEDLDAIRRVWKNVPYLGQGLSGAKAAETVDLWNQRKLPVLALHPFSAGHGLNLQAGGSHIAWYSLPWPLESYQQTNGRIDRQGQTRACYAHHIVVRNSMDQRVSDVLAQKDVSQAEIIAAIRRV